MLTVCRSITKNGLIDIPSETVLLSLFQRLRRALALVAIIPRDSRFTSFLLYQTIMFTLSLRGALGRGLAYGCVQL